MIQQMKPGLTSGHAPFSHEVHLTDYFNIIRKRKWTVIAFFLAVVCVVTVWSFSTTLVYKATTQIMIESQSSFINKMADATYIDPKDHAHYQTQYRLLMSRSLAKKAIEDLGLRKNFRGNNGKTPDTSVSSEAHMESSFVDWYLSNLQIVPIRETKLVNISFLSQSPEMATRIANAHAHAFIIRSAQFQHMISEQALDWLKTQVQNQKTRVGTSHQSVYEYAYEQLGSFSLDDKSVFSIPEIKENPLIKDLRGKLADLKARKSEMATKYGPKHPKMIEMNSSIQKLEQGIVDEAQTVRRAIKAELDKIIALEKTNQRTPDVQPKEDVPHTRKAITYDMVRLEAESDQEIYNILLKHAKEIGLTGSMEKNNIRIVDEAEVPHNPAKPKIFLNIILSVVLGLTFGTCLAFFIEYMDRTVRTSEDVTQRLGLPLLEILPYNKSWESNTMLALSWDEPDQKQKKRAEDPARYNISGSLMARLPIMQSGMSGQILLVESAAAGEGKTTVLASVTSRLLSCIWLATLPKIPPWKERLNLCSAEGFCQIIFYS